MRRITSTGCCTWTGWTGRPGAPPCARSAAPPGSCVPRRLRPPPCPFRLLLEESPSLRLISVNNSDRLGISREDLIKSAQHHVAPGKPPPHLLYGHRSLPRSESSEQTRRFPLLCGPSPPRHRGGGNDG